MSSAPTWLAPGDSTETATALRRCLRKETHRGQTHRRQVLGAMRVVVGGIGRGSGRGWDPPPSTRGVGAPEGQFQEDPFQENLFQEDHFQYGPLARPSTKLCHDRASQKRLARRSVGGRSIAEIQDQFPSSCPPSRTDEKGRERNFGARSPGPF